MTHNYLCTGRATVGRDQTKISRAVACGRKKPRRVTRNYSHRKITLNDIQLASIYYPILVDLAKHRHCLTYDELVARAKAENPEANFINSSIAVSVGRKLEVIRVFTSARDLPDITSLVISKGTGKVGRGFNGADPDKTRETVFNFNWDDRVTEYRWFVSDARKKAVTRKKRTKAAALKLMSDYYVVNRGNLPDFIRDSRDQIVSYLMDGYTEEQAFEMTAVSTDK